MEDYIRTHWRGEQSLARSFWINLVGLDILFILLITEISESTLTNTLVGLIAFFLLLILLILLAYPWQVVGTWRSAKFHTVRSGRSFAATTAQVVIALGVISTITQVGIQFPVFIELGRSALGIDQYEYQLKFLSEENLILIDGDLGHGVTDDVIKLLDENTVRGIILNSRGGWVNEGQSLARVISKYNLDTYSYQECSSACTIAYIAGRSRYLGRTANLGFHAFSSPLSQYAEIDQNLLNDSLEQKQSANAELFKKQGIGHEFVERMYVETGPALWFPTRDELIASGVVTEIVPVINTDQSLSNELSTIQIEELFSHYEAYRLIKEYDPDYWFQIFQSVETLLSQGYSLNDLAFTIQAEMTSYILKHLVVTSNDAAIDFIRSEIQTMELLSAEQPFNCLKYNYPEVYGDLSIATFLSSENMSDILAVRTEVLRTALKSPMGSADEQLAEESTERIIAMLSAEDLSYIRPSSDWNTQDDYVKACNALIHFYQAILRLNSIEAANYIRYAFRPEN